MTPLVSSGVIVLAVEIVLVAGVIIALVERLDRR